MDDTSGGAEGPDEVPGATSPGLGRAPTNQRQARARRRRRRRRIGAAIFVIVAGAVLATAYFAIAGGGGDSPDESAGTSTTQPAATTTTALAFAGGYKVTTGVNIRQGPGTTFPTVGTVEQGRTILVLCVVNGELVNAPSGPNQQWLKMTGFGPSGYVSAAFVTTGDDLRNNKIPACTS